jgi:raffinose/stachyose/melibiose transport system substrate-binding protein
MRKWLTIALSSLVTLVLLAGCASKDATDSTSSSNGKDVKLSFIHWRGEDTKVFNEIIKQFEQENPGIKVEMNVFPSEQYLASAQSKLLDGSSGDVFAAFPGAQFESIQQAGFYEDLTGASFLSNFTSNLIEAGQTDGKQYAIPYQLVYNQPIYNKKIFEKLGLEIPTDWDSFLATAQSLKDNGYIPIAFPGADIGPGQLMNTMMMNNNTDEEIWAKVESGEAKLTDAWWVTTLSQFKELNDKGYFQKDSLGTKKDTASVLFAQEKAALLATGSYMMSSNIQLNPDLEQGLLAPITVSQDKAVFQGVHTTTFMLGVNAKSEHKEEAKKFIEFLSKPEIATKYANETGQLVTVKDVTYSTKELQESAEWTSKKTRFQPRYLISNSNVEKAVVASIQSVLAGKEPAQAAAESQAIVDQNLKK